MKTRVTLRFLDEADRFALRYACDDCAHFSARETACAHGYPLGERRGRTLRDGDELSFCKEFEAG
jgi:hypothetical protein